MNRQSRLVLSIISACFAYQLSPDGDVFLAPTFAADPAFELANQAMVLYRANSVDEADRMASMAIQANPNNAEAHYVKGLIAFHKRHQAEEGKAEFDKAIALNPKLSVAYADRADLEWEQHQTDKAISDMSKAIELNPNESAFIFWRGTMNFNAKNYEQAVADYTRVLKMDPNNADAYNNRGQAYSEMKMLNEAIADTNKAISFKATSMLLNNRGWNYYDLKRYDEAKADFERGLKMEPKISRSYKGMAFIYIDRKQYELALPFCLKWLAAEPDAKNQSLEKVGFCYYKLEKYEPAITYYSKAMELSPKKGNLYLFRGSAYELSGKLEKALADYNHAIALDHDASSYMHRGFAYIALKRTEEAIKDFEKSISLDSKIMRTYEGLSQAYEKALDYDKALNALNAGLKIEPNNLELMQDRGHIYMTLKRPQDAINDYNRTIAAAPKNSLLLINRAIYENECGQFQKAIEDSNKAIAIESPPGSPEKWTNLKVDAIAELAKTYVLSGDPNKAIETIKPLIALDESKYPKANWENAKWMNQLAEQCLLQEKNGTNYVNNFADSSTAAKPLSQAQLWVLACCAIIIENNDYKHNVLWMVDYPPEANFVNGKPLSKWWLSVFRERQGIANSWDIHSRNDLLEMLHTLAANDNKSQSSSLPQATNDPLKKSSVASYLLDEDYSNASFLFSSAERKKHEEENRAFELRKQAAEKLGPKPKLAWNLCRFIYLCRAGVLCGYLTEAEAWTSMTAQARVLKENFPSWNELGSNYMMRRRVWNTDEESGIKSEKSFQKLTTNPNSPWRTIPWSTDLGAN